MEIKMKRYIKQLLCLGLGAIIAGCGFHLRGVNRTDYRFAYKYVYLTCDTPIICPGLISAIKNEELTTLVTRPESAEAVFVVGNEQTSRDVLDYNGVGQIASYLLSYQITAQVFDLKGNQVGNDIVVKNQMTINYNNSLILSAQQQEDTTWNQIHQNVINTLIRRLVHLKPILISPYEAESH